VRRQLIENRAGILDWYVPEGRVLDGTATLNIYIDGESLWPGTFPATVTQDPTDITLAATVKNSREITATTDTSAAVIGRRYLVTSTRGERVELVLKGVDATTLVFADPVPFALALNSTCKGLLLRYEPEADDTATRRRNIRAQYEYAIDGDAVVPEPFFFDVVKQKYGFSLSLSYLAGFWSSIRQHVHGMDWQTISNNIVADVVFPALEGMGFDPDLIRDQEKLKPWAALLTIEQILISLMADGQVNEKVLDHYSRQVTTALTRLIDSSKIWYDSGDTLTGSNRSAQFADSTDIWYAEDGTIAGGGEDFGLRVRPDPVI